VVGQRELARKQLLPHRERGQARRVGVREDDALRSEPVEVRGLRSFNPLENPLEAEEPPVEADVILPEAIENDNNHVQIRLHAHAAKLANPLISVTTESG
jgi:hypothetical protein